MTEPGLFAQMACIGIDVENTPEWSKWSKVVKMIINMNFVLGFDILSERILHIQKMNGLEWEVHPIRLVYFHRVVDHSSKMHNNHFLPGFHIFRFTNFFLFIR